MTANVQVISIIINKIDSLMHDRLGCWVDSVNQEVNTSWKTKKKWTLYVYGDNHRII
jgi:hypothetical protein